MFLGFLCYTAHFRHRVLIIATLVRAERCDSHLEGLSHIRAKDAKVRHFVRLCNTMSVRFSVFKFIPSARSVFLSHSGGAQFDDCCCELADMSCYILA